MFIARPAVCCWRVFVERGSTFGIATASGLKFALRLFVLRDPKSMRECDIHQCRIAETRVGTIIGPHFERTRRTPNENHSETIDPMITRVRPRTQRTTQPTAKRFSPILGYAAFRVINLDFVLQLFANIR